MAKTNKQYFLPDRNNKDLNLSGNKDFQDKYEMVKKEIKEVMESTKVDSSKLKQRFDL